MPSPKKKKTSKGERPDRLPPDSRPLSPSGQPGAKKPSFDFRELGLPVALLAGAVFLLTRHDLNASTKILLTTALVILMIQLYRQGRIPIRRIPGFQKIFIDTSRLTGGAAILFLLLIACFSILLISFPSFSWMMPLALRLPFKESYPVLLFLWVGLIIGFRILPERSSGTDLSAPVAYGLLTLFLGLGAYLCLYQGFSPMGAYGSVQATEILDVRRVADLNDFGDAFVFPLGYREPFFAYLCVFLWKLFPSMTSLVTQRIAGVAVDLATICALYLIGKELLNRRLGLWAAALGAVSKPLIMRTLQGLSLQSLSLGVALALLFFVRLLRKPTPARFVQWGLALSFGAYTYTPYRIFIPFFLFVSWVWVWARDSKERRLDFSAKILLLTTLAYFTLYFLYTIGVFPANNLFTYLCDWVYCGPPAVLLALYLVFAVYILRKPRDWSQSGTWTGWLAGSWMSVILTFPVMTHESLVKNVQAYIVTPGGIGWMGYFSRIYSEAVLALQTLFFNGTDRLDMLAPKDSFFGYSEIVLIALGLAVILARLSWERIGLLLTALAGITPYFLTQQAHTGRLIGCVVPFLVLGAMGLEELWSRLPQNSPNRWETKLFCLFLAGFAVWTVRVDIQHIYGQWFLKYQDRYIAVERQARQDIDHGNLVFLTDGVGGSVAGALYEGHPACVLHPTNFLYQDPKETKGHDVVVYFEAADSATKDRIQKETPAAQFNPVKGTDPVAGEIALALRCQIPVTDISNATELYSKAQKRYARITSGRAAQPGKPLPPVPQEPLFEVKPITAPFWERRYASGKSGLGFGILDIQDRAVSVTDATAPPINMDTEAVQVEGKFHMEKGGKYEVNLKADGRTKIWIDGHEWMDAFFARFNRYPDGYVLASPLELRKVIPLEAGDHRLKVVTCYQKSQKLPDILIRQESAPKGTEKSIWNSFNL